jgi:hypothetical protein
MPQIRFDDVKGLEQRSGSGLVAVPSLAQQSLAEGNAEKTINIRKDSSSEDTFSVPVTTAGVTTNVRVQAAKTSTEVGQMLLLINQGADTIAFAAAADSKISGLAGGEVLKAGASLLLVWTGSAWSLTSQTLA